MEPTLNDWAKLFQQIQKVATKLENTQEAMHENSEGLASIVDEVKEVSIDFKRHKSWHTAVNWCMGLVCIVLSGIASQIKWAVLF